MKKSDISAKFAPYIADAISEGFAPCLTELSGSYSGIMGHQMVFAKSNERIVMWMEQQRGNRLEGTLDTVSLLVARFALKKGETCDFHYMWPQDWKRNLVAQMVVYEVSPCKTGWYVEDADEATHAIEVRRSRYGNRRHTVSFREYEVNDNLLRIARKLRGFKTIRRENLHVCKAGSRWVFQNKVSHREVCVG